MGGRPRLSKGELAVANAIWKIGEATVGSVFEELSESRDIDYSTVQTYIRRLEAKGYVQARRVGRTKIYSAKVRPRQVIREAIDELLGTLFNGEAMPLVRHLIAHGDISDEEIGQMRQLLNKLEEDRGDSSTD